MDNLFNASTQATHINRFLQHVRPPNKGYLLRLNDKNPLQVSFLNNADAVTLIERTLANNKVDTFVSLAQFPTESVARTSENAESFMSVWIDIDCECGDGKIKPYKTKVAGCEALDQFLQNTKLPSPSILVDSGGGWHVYWCFDQPISKDDWLPLAENLKRLCLKAGLEIDPACTGDAARVMRVVGSQNWKLSSPRPVSITYPDIGSAIETFRFDSFLSLIRTADQIITPQQKKTTISKFTSTSAATQPKTVLTDIQIRDLRCALLYLRADERKLWIEIGMALYCLGEVGRGLWMEWSATSSKFDAAEAARVWDSFKPTKINYKSIFTKAQSEGWLNPAKNLNHEAVHAETIDADGWPEPKPLPPALKTVPELNPDHLPDAFKNGVVDIADRLQCTLDFVAIPLLVGSGSLIGNKVGIYPKAQDETWKVHPALWGAIVGPPGSMKTPAQQEAFRTIQHLERQAGIEYSQDLAQHEIAVKQFESSLKSFTSGKTNSFPTKPEPPKRKRYLVNDTTYQALSVVLSENPSGILALGDELSGLLKSLDTPGQEAARGFYLSGWGGSGDCIIDRIGRASIHLHSYCISLFGGFQPDRIKAYVRETQSGSSNNDGLIQRFQMIVWPDQIQKLKIVDRPPNKNALAAIDKALLGLSTLEAETRLHFHKSAQTLFNDWFQANESLLREGKLDPARHSHFAKYRSLIPGLALLIHLIDGHPDEVCYACLEKSISFSTYLKGHANRIYGSVQGQDHAPLKALAGRLLSGALQSGFSQRDLLHKGWVDLSDKARAFGAIEGLVVRGWLVEVEKSGIGRPTIEYLINPRIRSGSFAGLEVPP